LLFWRDPTCWNFNLHHSQTYTKETNEVASMPSQIVLTTRKMNWNTDTLPSRWPQKQTFVLAAGKPPKDGQT
jgi:hypothetical protein